MNNLKKASLKSYDNSARNLAKLHRLRKNQNLKMAKSVESIIPIIKNIYDIIIMVIEFTIEFGKLNDCEFGCGVVESKSQLHTKLSQDM